MHNPNPHFNPLFRSQPFQQQQLQQQQPSSPVPSKEFGIEKRISDRPHAML
jgi:hypothetical protein